MLYAFIPSYLPENKNRLTLYSTELYSYYTEFLYFTSKDKGNKNIVSLFIFLSKSNSE
jgi:hypothetical protein